VGSLSGGLEAHPANQPTSHLANKKAEATDLCFSVVISVSRFQPLCSGIGVDSSVMVTWLFMMS